MVQTVQVLYIAVFWPNTNHMYTHVQLRSEHASMHTVQKSNLDLIWLGFGCLHYCYSHAPCGAITQHQKNLLWGQLNLLVA